MKCQSDRKDGIYEQCVSRVDTINRKHIVYKRNVLFTSAGKSGGLQQCA